MLQSVIPRRIPFAVITAESDEFVNGSYNSDVFAELPPAQICLPCPTKMPQSTEYNTIIKEEVELALNLKQTRAGAAKHL